MSNAPEYELSLSFGFNKDGVPKRPYTAQAYSEGWEPHTLPLAHLMEHVSHGGAWSQTLFSNQQRSNDNAVGVAFPVAEYDLPKCDHDKTLPDYEKAKQTNPTIEEVIELGRQGHIAAAYLSQSCDPSQGVFAGRLIPTMSRPLAGEELQLYRGVAEVFHRDIEALTGKHIGDRCGTGIARWWAGCDKPEKVLFCNSDLVVYDTDELIERAQEEVIKAEPFKYLPKRNNTPGEKTPLSKATVRVIRWLFDEGLPPPDADSFQGLVSPAKALTRLYSPTFDEDFCNWIRSSAYRLRSIGGSAERFLYSGQQFNCASVGWFIRRVDEYVPDWREVFKQQFGYPPGLDNFNPTLRGRAVANSDF